jgi:hypothetical protein
MEENDKNYNGLPLAELVVLARKGLTQETRLLATRRERLIAAQERLQEREKDVAHCEKVAALALKALF